MRRASSTRDQSWRWLARRAFGHRFFTWYNDERHHSGLGFLPPAVVHHGLAEGVRVRSQHVLAAAYAAHPERFAKGTARLADLPHAVWINPPERKTLAQDAPRSTITASDDLRVDLISHSHNPSG